MLSIVMAVWGVVYILIGVMAVLVFAILTSVLVKVLMEDLKKK